VGDLCDVSIRSMEGSQVVGFRSSSTTGIITHNDSKDLLNHAAEFF
jgi:hypothetical protein